jgi:peptide chain release factor 2
MEELSGLKRNIEEFDRVQAAVSDLSDLDDVAGEDESFRDEFEREFNRVEKLLDEYELETSLSDPDDVKNAYLTVHPGAGGVESQDWAEMLLEMYIRWAETHDYGCKVVTLQKGEEAGIKDATLFITGRYAHGYLKTERGIHRLVRISPYDSANRRHTSFASVYVYPEAKDVEISIKESDLKIDTYRSSGPGGQHMQKTESAVRIRHMPTGVVVTCESERSQHQNKEYAMKVLRARLYQYYKEKEQEKLDRLESEKGDIAWGNQIRSYVLHPYKMVKDHRTGVEISQPEKVLDGDLDELIQAELLRKK